MATKTSVSETYKKVNIAIKELNYSVFSIGQLSKITNIHQETVKRILLSMLEFGYIKYSESTNLYIEVNKNE